MSGTKYADIRLQQRAARLVEARQGKERADTACGALLEELEAVCEEAAGMRLGEPRIRREAEAAGEALRRWHPALEEWRSRVRALEVPGAPSGSSDKAVGEVNARLSEVVREMQEARDEIARVRSELARLSCADGTLSELRVALGGLRGAFAEHRDLLERWEPEDAAAVRGGLEALEREPGLRGTVGGQAGAAGAGNPFAASLEKARALERRCSEAAVRAAAADGEHRRRLYVLAALRDVCRSMGFRELGDPFYERSGESRSAAVLEVDTLNRGRVTFRIALGGSIEADSGIHISGCDAEYSLLSQLLGEAYGVESEFRLAGGEPLPKRIEKDARPSPKRDSRRDGREK